MDEKFYSILTSIGKAKIANSLGLGTKIDFVKMKVGDGGGKYYNPIETQVNLVNTVWEGNIGHVSVDDDNPNWINIEVLIPPTDGGFMIREYGVFDKDNNMLAIAKCAETYKPTASDGNTKEINIKMVLAVSNVSSINLKIDPTIIFAKKKEIEEIETKLLNIINPIKEEIKISRGNFKSLNERLNNNDTFLKEIANDSYPIVEGTGVNIYVGSTARITKLSKGTRCTLFVSTDSTGNCNLNLNNYGVKNIKDSFGNIVTNLKANIPYNLCYNGSDFILQGKGGGGNLIPKYLLQGYYGDGDNGRINGSMVNRGAPVVNLNCGGTFNLQEGYYSGGQAIANSLASQTPGTATADKIMQGLTAWVNGSKINGNATLQSLGGGKIKIGIASNFEKDNGYDYISISNLNLDFTPSAIIAQTNEMTPVFWANIKDVYIGNWILNFKDTGKLFVCDFNSSRLYISRYGTYVNSINFIAFE